MSHVDPLAWSPIRAPTLDELAALGAAAFARLPAGFRALAEGLVVQVAEFPSDEVLDEMGLESPFDLLGLFQGIGLAQAEAVAPTGRLPNMIWLYRRPILDHWAENEESLGDLVTHVLIHEIGHHMGLSDADIDRLESEARGAA